MTPADLHRRFVELVEERLRDRDLSRNACEIDALHALVAERTRAAATDLVDALTKAANMLGAVAGDIEDGYSLSSLRGKYLMAVVNARDDARAAIARTRPSAPSIEGEGQDG